MNNETLRIDLCEEEIWKPVIGYEGLYEISDKGNVRSLNRLVNHNYGGKSLRKGKVLKKCFDTHGYVLYGLSKDGKTFTHRAHRLVAEAFIENKENKPFINHKNLMKDDNRLENLEWCSHYENVEHYHKLMDNELCVYAYHIDSREEFCFPNIKLCAEYLKVKHGVISSSLSRLSFVSTHYLLSKVRLSYTELDSLILNKFQSPPKFKRWTKEEVNLALSYYSSSPHGDKFQTWVYIKDSMGVHSRYPKRTPVAYRLKMRQYLSNNQFIPATNEYA